MMKNGNTLLKRLRAVEDDERTQALSWAAWLKQEDEEEPLEGQLFDVLHHLVELDILPALPAEMEERGKAWRKEHEGQDWTEWKAEIALWTPAAEDASMLSLPWEILKGTPRQFWKPRARAKFLRHAREWLEPCLQHPLKTDAQVVAILDGVCQIEEELYDREQGPSWDVPEARAEGRERIEALLAPYGPLPRSAFLDL